MPGWAAGAGWKANPLTPPSAGKRQLSALSPHNTCFWSPSLGCWHNDQDLDGLKQDIFWKQGVLDLGRSSFHHHLQLPMSSNLFSSLCPSVTQHAPYVAVLLCSLYKATGHRIQFSSKIVSLVPGTGLEYIFREHVLQYIASPKHRC